MAIPEVYRPKPAGSPFDQLAQPMNMIGTGMSVYGTGAKAGWWGKTPAPDPTPKGGSPTPTGGETAAGGESGSTAAGGESLGWGAAGPIAIGVAGMVGGQIAQADYQRKGSKAGNAPYASKTGSPQLTYSWDPDTLSKRMDIMSTRYEMGMNPTDVRRDVENLPLSRSDKDSILGKLGKAFNFSSSIKVG